MLKCRIICTTWESKTGQEVVHVREMSEAGKANHCPSDSIRFDF